MSNATPIHIFNLRLFFMRIRNWKCDLFNEGWNKNSRTISDFAAIYGPSGPWTLSGEGFRSVFIRFFVFSEELSSSEVWFQGENSSTII